MTADLRARAASSIPVPRPATSFAPAPVQAAITAAADVVFPIPMSPVTSRRAPSSTASNATVDPDVERGSYLVDGHGRTRWPGCVSPGPPCAAVRALRCGDRGGHAHVDHDDPAPTRRASTLMAAPPAQKLATICAVTSCGHGVTPSSTTPWSPANTATVTGSGTGGGHSPSIAHSWMPMSSTRPRAPRGLVRLSWCCLAPAASASLTGRTAARASSKSRTHHALPLSMAAAVAASCAPVAGIARSASSRRSRPEAAGTAMRTMPGIPKLAQSRTTTPSGASRARNPSASTSTQLASDASGANP